MKQELLPMTFKELSFQLSNSYIFTQEACKEVPYSPIADYLNLDKPLYRYTTAGEEIIVYDYGKLVLVEASPTMVDSLASTACLSSVSKALSEHSDTFFISYPVFLYFFRNVQPLYYEDKVYLVDGVSNYMEFLTYNKADIVTFDHYLAMVTTKNREVTEGIYAILNITNSNTK